MHMTLKILNAGKWNLYYSIIMNRAIHRDIIESAAIHLDNVDEIQVPFIETTMQKKKKKKGETGVRERK